MAEEYGSIVINADLNPKSFEQSSKEMAKAVQSLHSKVEGLGPTFRKALQGNISAMNQFNAKASGLSETIANIEREMDRLGKKEVETQEYKNLQEELEKVNAKAVSLRKRLATATSAKQKSSLTQQLEEATTRSDELLQKIVELEDSGKHMQLGGDTEQYAQLRAAIDGIKEELGDMQVSAKSAKVALIATGQTKTAFSALWKAIRNGVKSLLQTKKQSSGLANSIGKLTRGLTSFVGRLKSRVMRSIISGVFSGVKEGINNLAQVVPSLNESLSQIKSGLTTLKNSFATAFAPIITAVVPYLATLINYCSAAVTWIGKLIAALSGASTFTQATAVQQDYAESLSNTAGAAKDLKRQLAGFDQLNILSENSGGGGGGSSLSPSEMFEEVPIESSIRQWASRLKQAFEEQNYEDLGQILGQGLQSVFTKALEYVSSVDYASYGVALALIFNGIFEAFDLSTVSATIVTLVNGIFSFLFGLFTTLDWNGIATNVASAITTALRMFDWKTAAQTISAFATGLLGAIATAVSVLDWQAFGRGVADFIINIDWVGLLSSVGEIIAGVFIGVLTAVQSAIQRFNISDTMIEFQDAAQSIREQVDALNRDLENKTSGIDAQKEYANQLIDKLDALEKKYGPVATQNEEYQTTIQALCDIYPDLIGYIDKETGAFSLTNEQLRDQVELLTNKLKIEALSETYIELEKLRRSAKKNKEATAAYVNKLNDLKEALESHNKISQLTTEQQEALKEVLGENLNLNSDTTGALHALTSILSIANADLQTYTEDLDKYDGELKDLEAEMTSLQSTTKTTTGEIKKDVVANMDEVENAFRRGTDTIETESTKWGGAVGNASDTINSHITHKIAPAFETNLPLAVETGLADATKTVKDGVDDMKTNFNAIKNKLKDPIGTVKVAIDDTYETVKESWESIKATEITKTIGGNVTQSFKDAKTSYDSITSETITKTVDGRKTEGFARAQRDYESITDRTVNLSFNGNGLSATAREIFGLAKGGAIMSSGKMSWWGGVQKYASGTMRAHGSLFVAGEAGPEVVGHVNGRTEVLNKSQIASSIYNAVMSAIKSVFSSPIPVQLSMIGGASSMFSALSAVGHYEPCASTMLPYDVQRIVESIDSLSDQIEQSSDDVARRVVDALVTQTTAIVTAIRSSKGTSGGNGDLIDQINRQTRMYGTPQILGG